jgi:hypothetical protein
MNGAMAGAAVFITILGVLAFTTRNHVSTPGRKALCERLAAGLFGLAAAAGMIAFAPALAVLWQVTGTGPGLVVLASLLVITGFFGFLMVFRGKGHHHHGSIAVTALFGVTATLAVGGWHQIRRSLGKSAASAGHGAGGVVSGSALTGTSAHQQVLAAASTSGGRWVIIAALLILAVALIVFLRGYRKASRASAPRRSRGGGGSGGRPGAAPLPAGPAVRPGGPAAVAGDAR